MDAHSQEIKFLALSCRRATEELRRRTRSVSEGEDVQGVQLCAYIDACLDAIEARLVELGAQPAGVLEEIDKDAIAQEMRFLNAAVRSLHLAGKWLREAHQWPTDIALLFFLDQAAKALLQVEVEFITSRDDRYMYSSLALDRPFSGLLEDLSSALPDGPTPILLNFPVSETETVLLYPVFVHELGHDAIARHQLRRAVFSSYADIDQLNKDFVDAVSSYTAVAVEAGESFSEEEASRGLRKMLHDWVDELICDQLALLFVGPSYLFSAAGFLLPAAAPVPSASHPPVPLRLNVLLQTVTTNKWRDSLEAEVPRTMEWLDTVAARRSAVDWPDFLKFMASAAEALSETVRSVVRGHLKGTTFEVPGYESDSSYITNLLENGILPAQLESGDAPDPRSVLLSAWLYQLRKSDDEPEGIAAAIDDEEFQRFISSALEMSCVLSRWRQ